MGEKYKEKSEKNNEYNEEKNNEKNNKNKYEKEKKYIAFRFFMKKYTRQR